MNEYATRGSAQRQSETERKNVQAAAEAATMAGRERG
jgi:hypothetical protein